MARRGGPAAGPGSCILNRMGENTFRHELGASASQRGGSALQSGGSAMEPGGSASMYWRRRFMVLVIGLAVFALAAWTLSDALKVAPGTSAPVAPRPGQSGHGLAPGNGTQQASRSSAPARTRPRPRPSPTASGTVRGFRGFQPPFCARSSIVLSLSATQARFGPRQVPDFSLSVVSTQPTACSFNVGSGHLALVIKEGPERIWSSADCVSGTPSLVSALRRGVPTVVAIGWNRKTSSPGCTSPARLAPAGSYTGYAVDGSITSAPVTFRLS